nr:MAG TPA: hypothetical protein [Caudoviricetes sp.]
MTTASILAEMSNQRALKPLMRSKHGWMLTALIIPGRP